MNVRGHCLLLLSMLVLLVGCVSEPPVPPVPTASSSQYDILWQATRDVVEKRFDVFAAHKDQGTMITDYKISEPFPALWAKDSQNLYDTLEETGYIVRRKAVAVITKNSQGDYDLKLTVLRERQAYAPPNVVYSTAYDLYEARTGPAPQGLPYDETMTWTRLANDTYLEAKMVAQIKARAAKLSARK
jgi:hypothetical protein